MGGSGFGRQAGAKLHPSYSALSVPIHEVEVVAPAFLMMLSTAPRVCRRPVPGKALCKEASVLRARLGKGSREKCEETWGCEALPFFPPQGRYILGSPPYLPPPPPSSSSSSPLPSSSDQWPVLCSALAPAPWLVRSLIPYTEK